MAHARFARRGGFLRLARRHAQERDLVAEAIGEKLKAAVAGGALEGRRAAWERWKARLEQLPDGSWVNPLGIEDESFFRSLEEVRRESWVSRDPFVSEI